ncbi:oxidoreductase [Acrocarpospora pleiomorpha]|uniref:Oxidoreductase n=1 Tax=Acrocarpospora pleiomorpha TaxID=90975 RepID=A0A5M3XL15_9ACTN|nr:SDR family NAD(P)-dependent oxidoreductase [Acrocarpospora pleiomorpha]GES20341.1 oxidoreductase [Acrocarpospora pleiomorpha]
MRLAGARVLITGASSGVGAATARVMAEAGARLVLAGRDKARLEAVAAETGGCVVVSDVMDGVDELAERAGAVDVLVNNAGVGWAGPLAGMPQQRADELVAVNMAAPIQLTRLLLPGMVAKGEGHIVFVASIAGAIGVGNEAVYSATKAGLLVFAEALHHELRGSRRVGVSTVLPGVVDTPFFDRRGAGYERRWPRPIPPERVARAIVTAIRRGRAESYVPAWLRLPARLRGAAPGPFRRLARPLG